MPDREREAERSDTQSRRQFLKRSALAATAAAAARFVPRAAARPRAAGGAQAVGRANQLPGRIVLYRDPAMHGELPTIDRDRVEEVVLGGVRLLTGLTDTAAAFESLFPGLHAGSTFAIKVNCLAWNDTRWEVVRGIVSGLSRMLGGTYDVSQVIIYDVQTTLSNHGYVDAEFTFGGRTPLITSTNNCSGSYYVYGGHRLSNHVIDSDYLINVPVLKAHNVGYPEHQITTALKNHYGSICPQSLCNNIPGMLTVNADTHIKDKTSLLVTSALRGTYQGGPWEPAQPWSTYPEYTPNTIVVTTDPVTESYWARELINTERVAQSMTAFDCPWVEEATAPPYELGVSDPAAMTVIHADPTAIIDAPVSPARDPFLAPNVPNPFRTATTIRFRLPRAGLVSLAVATPGGRLVRRLAARSFPAGDASVQWDGRDQRGRRAPAGVYLVRLESGAVVQTRRVVLLH